MLLSYFCVLLQVVAIDATQQRLKLKNCKAMKLKNIMSALVGLGLVGGVLPLALAQSGKEGESGKPPPAVEATITQAIKAAYPDAVIKKMGKESEDGISFYEVKLTVNGNKMDADVTSDGTIIETEAAADIS